MVIVFFNIEKAYDSMRRIGLLIKMNKVKIGGRLYNWVMDFTLHYIIVIWQTLLSRAARNQGQVR